MSDQFLGEIRLFAGNFPPKGFAFCNGQLLPISRYTGLFSILGVMYGGDGKTTFALPNLLGCLPMHFSPDATPGRSPRPQGQKVGSGAITLNPTQLPSHSHTVTALNTAANQTAPNPNSYPGVAPGSRGQQGPPVYAQAGVAATALHPQTVINNGGSQPFDIHQPYVALNFIIAIEGVNPPHH